MSVRRFRRYPAYQQTSMALLREVPAQWSIMRLGHLGTLSKGRGGTKDDEAPEGIPCIRYGDLYTTHDGFIEKPRSYVAPDRATDYTRIHPGDVLFAASGETLEEIGMSAVNLLEAGARCGGDIIIFRPRAPLDHRFLGFATNSSFARAQKSTMGRGMTVYHIYGGELKCLTLLVPPLGEQRAIAAFLDRETAKIDALIAKKERLIELLQEKRTSLITQAISRGLDPAVPMRDSGVEWLGQIPAHWQVRRLKHISPHQSVGVVVNPSSYFDQTGTVPILLGSNVAEGAIDANGAKRITTLSSELLRKSKLHAGDLVTVRVGDPGVTAVVPPELDGCNCASVMFIRRHERYDSQWLMYAMNSRVGRYQVEVVQYGAAQKQFNISHAVDFLYPFPPLDEQRRISAFLGQAEVQLREVQVLSERHIALLREYRTALISAAVTGQIDVRGEVA